MEAIPILLSIFLGVGAMVSMMTLAGSRARVQVLQAKKALAEAERDALPLPPPPADPNAAPVLALKLPPAQRQQVWDILCTLADAPGELPARERFTLEQAASDYLPETLRSYLNLSDADRQRLRAQGMTPEGLLSEQLQLIAEGVREALSHDHARADRLLTQGRFLRERFGGGERLMPELKEAEPVPVRHKD